MGRHKKQPIDTSLCPVAMRSIFDELSCPEHAKLWHCKKQFVLNMYEDEPMALEELNKLSGKSIFEDARKFIDHRNNKMEILIKELEESEKSRQEAEKSGLSFGQWLNESFNKNDFKD